MRLDWPRQQRGSSGSPIAHRPLPSSTPSSTPSSITEAQLTGARDAIRVEGTLPSLSGAVSVRIDTRPNIAVGTVPWGVPADVVVDAYAADPLALLGRGGTAPLIVQVHDADRQPETRTLIGEMVAWQRPVVVVEWGWPGPSSGDLPRVCTFGASLPSRSAVAELLREAGWNR